MGKGALEFAAVVILILFAYMSLTGLSRTKWGAITLMVMPLVVLLLVLFVVIATGR